ncbi:hypothetical protein FRC10_006068 [Ceratobasidium sp. 414]|nr:hypothetical protein FRC10_006068 [Ceratobasidium sp. 414]
MVYYDKNDKAVSFGAEALKPETAEKVEAQGWRLAQHFNLHLYPEAMKQRHNLKVQRWTAALPAGITLDKIYTDFMGYLMKHTQEFFETRIIDGRKVWEDLHKDMTIVLAHPNGWTIREQNFLRKAAVAANYTSDAKAHAQVHFVSEAEASVHFCMFHSDIHNRLNLNANFIVCDAGGSMVDTTAYCVKSVSPMLELEEKKASACVQAGAVFVDLEFEKHLAGILNRIGLDDEERNDCLRIGVKDFGSSARKAFGLVGPDGELLERRIDIGCRLQRPEFKIKRGSITLSRRAIRSIGLGYIFNDRYYSDTIKTFFDNCVEKTVASIRQQMSGLNPKLILLMGEFGDSPYLQNRLSSEFDSAGCQVTVANDSTFNASTDGAVIWSTKLSGTSHATGICSSFETNDPRCEVDAVTNTSDFWVRLDHGAETVSNTPDNVHQKMLANPSINQEEHEQIKERVSKQDPRRLKKLTLRTLDPTFGPMKPEAREPFGTWFVGLLQDASNETVLTLVQLTRATEMLQQKLGAPFRTTANTKNRRLGLSQAVSEWLFCARPVLTSHPLLCLVSEYMWLFTCRPDIPSATYELLCCFCFSTDCILYNYATTLFDTNGISHLPSPAPNTSLIAGSKTDEVRVCLLCGYAMLHLSFCSLNRLFVYLFVLKYATLTSKPFMAGSMFLLVLNLSKQWLMSLDRPPSVNTLRSRPLSTSLPIRLSRWS